MVTPSPLPGGGRSLHSDPWREGKRALARLGRINRPVRPSIPAGQVAGPVIHEPAPALEQVRPPVGCLDRAADLVCQGSLRHLARMIGRRSRYASAALYTGLDETFLGTRQRVDTTPRPDDRFHTVIEGDRVDRLAARYLGRAELWWVICDYNDVFFPLELEVGAVLRIPSLEYVTMRLIG